MRKIHKSFLKCDFFGAGTAIAGGAQAVGNVTAATIAANATKHAADQSLQGQREANQTNIDIMRETNAQNLQLSQMQNQWNLEQWQRENEYNSPSNQMKLYKQAGLNPALAQGEFSPAQHLESAPLAVAQPTTVQNPAADAAQIKMQGALAQSQYFKDLVGNAVDVARGIGELKKTKSDINQIKANIENTYKQNRKLDLENDILDQSKSALIKRAFLENKKCLEDRKLVSQQIKSEKERTKYQSLLNDMQKQNNDILSKSAAWLIREPEARVKNLLSQAFKASQEGNYQQFLNGYVAKNNRGIPTSTIDILLQELADVLKDKVGGIKNLVENPLGALTDAIAQPIKSNIKKAKELITEGYEILKNWAVHSYLPEP